MEADTSNPSGFLKIVPVYPLTSSLAQGFFRKIIKEALEVKGKYAENEIPISLVEKNNLLEKKDALLSIHFPADREKLSAAILTIKYEEFFTFQKEIIESKKKRSTLQRPERLLKQDLRKKIEATLPYTLTDDQAKALNDIYSDGNSKTPMHRILQGDVGCGKTIVGFLAALSYIESGYQVAFMAPTELLARQHLETAAKLLKEVQIAYLTGRLTEKKKALVRKALEDGEVELIIGTHALFSEPVKFKNLGFAIVDEQHKFGVAQRNSLAAKGDKTDYLMMSATPIPRTLQMTFFGDIEISTIATLPKGRGEIKTHSVLEENIQKVYAWVKRELDKGLQAYFVYPLIEESEHLNLKNAQAMFTTLQNDIFPDYRCAMLHSRVTDDEKETIMHDFSAGKVQILSATSVVEVGIDVPKATCMIIWHADRFSLTALHQLRGRIGRGSYQSYAFLVFTNDLSDTGKKRLRVIKETTDGFKIAEEDLKLRGPGDVTGLRQSGFADFRLADITDDKDILEKARTDALEYYL